VKRPLWTFAAGVAALSVRALHGLDSDGSARVDPEQARDIARWRRVERERLIAQFSLGAVHIQHRSQGGLTRI
jgi:hypothetical protein